MRSSLLLAVALAACSPDWELPEGSLAKASVRIEPFGSLDRAPEVLRLRVEGALGRSSLPDFRLFHGELGAYHLGRLRARELPKTLLEREVRAVVWSEPPDVLVAPTEVLAEDRYSLATPELGLVAAFDVHQTGQAFLARWWPPPETPSGTGLAVFCGDAAAEVDFGTLELAPAAVVAVLGAGLDEGGAFAETCVRIEPEDRGAALPDGALLLPPLPAAGTAFEPVPLVVRAEAASAPACEANELTLGPACALVDDDRLVVRAPASASLWALEAPARVLGIAAPGSSLVVRGLKPGMSSRISGRAFDLAGTKVEIDEAVTAAPRREHVVINEVLANPAGQEASGEWIELANDGATAAELGGLRLLDTGGAFELPDVRLEPGEFALLVGPKFALDPELDEAPAPSTKLLALASLGKAGLSNGGELLRLLNAEGDVVSRWPALAAPASGQSLARRTPDALDGESASFAPHASPGASPGGPNLVEAPVP